MTEKKLVPYGIYRFAPPYTPTYHLAEFSYYSNWQGGDEYILVTDIFSPFYKKYTLLNFMWWCAEKYNELI